MKRLVFIRRKKIINTMNYIRILGIDPGVTACGFAYGLYFLDTQKFVPSMIWTIKNDHKVSQEDGEKIKSNFAHLENFSRLLREDKTLNWCIRDDLVICIELANGASHSSADKRLSETRGLFAHYLSQFNRRKFILFPPGVKKALTGDGNAEKFRMVCEAVRRYPWLSWEKEHKVEVGISAFGTDRIVSENEHMADACGVVEACIQSEDFQEAVKTGKGLKIYRMKNDFYPECDIQRYLDLDESCHIRHLTKYEHSKFDREWRSGTCDIAESLKPFLIGADYSFVYPETKQAEWNRDPLIKKYKEEGLDYTHKRLWEVICHYAHFRAVFFSDRWLVNIIEKYGYVKVLKLCGYYSDTIVEEDLDQNLERVNEYCSREAEKVKKVSVDLTGIDDLRDFLQNYKDVKAELKKLREPFVDTLAKIRWLFDAEEFQKMKEAVESFGAGKNPEIQWSLYFKYEMELAEHLIGQISKIDKALSQLDKKLNRGILTKKNAIEEKNKVNIKPDLSEYTPKKTSTKKEEKKTSTDPSAPKRGRGRPKGSPNKKTLERERLKALNSEAPERGFEVLTPEVLDREWKESMEASNRELDELLERLNAEKSQESP